MPRKAKPHNTMAITGRIQNIGSSSVVMHSRPNTNVATASLLTARYCICWASKPSLSETDGSGDWFMVSDAVERDIRLVVSRFSGLYKPAGAG